VTKYTLAYGYDKDDLQDYNIDGEIKVMFYVIHLYFSTPFANDILRKPLILV
jgi:hypothetical protein